MFSYRDGAGVPRQQTIWRPRLSINSCCLSDVRARERFWVEFETRIDDLHRPPLDESAAGILLDRLDWLRAAIAQTVRPVTDDDYAELLESLMKMSAAAGR